MEFRGQSRRKSFMCQWFRSRKEDGKVNYSSKLFSLSVNTTADDGYVDASFNIGVLL